MPVGEEIFKGATRPAMMFGVPIIPFIVVFGTALLLTMWGGALLSWWVAPFTVSGAAFAIFWMRWATKKDDQRLHQILLRVKLTAPQSNRGFWRARSYAPLQWRGTKDGYRR